MFGPTLISGFNSGKLTASNTPALSYRPMPDTDKPDRNDQLRRSAFNWDDLQALYAVHQTGSFSRAGGVLNRKQQTVSASIARLESRLDASLVERGPKGATLTPLGRDVIDKVQSIYNLAIDIEHSTLRQDDSVTGLVRLNCPQGLGILWIAPRLAEFHEDNPDIRLQMRVTDTPTNVITEPVDLAIYFEPHKNMEAVALPLGRSHYQLFATQTYAARHGMPQNQFDILRHRLLYMTGYDRLRNVWGLETESFAALARKTGNIVLETDSFPIMGAAFINGAGIAALPTYFPASSEWLEFEQKNIIHLDFGFRQSFPFWVVFQRERGEQARVRRVINWLKDLFSAPCFQNDYVPPSAFSGVLTAKLGG